MKMNTANKLSLCATGSFSPRQSRESSRTIPWYRFLACVYLVRRVGARVDWTKSFLIRSHAGCGHRTIASSQLSSSTWGATIASPWAKPGAGWAGRVKGMAPWVCCRVCVHTFVVLELAQLQPVALPVAEIHRNSATFKKFTRNSRSRIPLALPLALTRPATGTSNHLSNEQQWTQERVLRPPTAP